MVTLSEAMGRLVAVNLKRKEATWRTRIGQTTRTAHAVIGAIATLAAADRVVAGRRVQTIVIGIGISVITGSAG